MDDWLVENVTLMNSFRYEPLFVKTAEVVTNVLGCTAARAGTLVVNRNNRASIKGTAVFKVFFIIGLPFLFTIDHDAEDNLLSDPKKYFFEIAWLAHKDSIYSMLCFCLNNKSEAEELLQEVAVRAYGNWHQLRDEGKAKEWMYAITRNLIRQYYRYRRRVIPMDDMAMIQKPTEINVDVISVRNALNELAELDLYCIILYRLYGISGRQIAKMLKVGKDKVYAAIKRAEMKLKRAISDE